MPRSHQARKWPGKAHLHFPVCEKPSGAKAAAPGGRAVSQRGALLLLPPTPPTRACHMAPGRSGACGGVSPGRLCREPWELHPVGGGGGGAHVQVHARAHASTLWLSLSLSLSLWFLHFLCSSSRGMSAAGSVPPDWGLTERNLQGQKWQGTLEISQASHQLSSVRSRTLDVRTGAAWGEVRVFLSTYIEHIR